MPHLRSRPLITVAVFDLDDTLYDCQRQRVLAAHRHAARKMLFHGLARNIGRKLSMEGLVRLRQQLFRENRNLDTLDYRLCLHLGLRGRQARRLARIGRDAYFTYPVRNLRLFSDTRPTLARLHKRGVRICLLTAGFLHIQRAKIRLLKLERTPYIHHIYYTGLTGGRGKKKYLRRVLQVEPDADHVLVVGDRPDSEIRAANELRMWTVQRRGGEFATHKPRNRLERPDFTIRRLSELFRLDLAFGRPQSG